MSDHQIILVKSKCSGVLQNKICDIDCILKLWFNDNLNNSIRKLIERRVFKTLTPSIEKTIIKRAVCLFDVKIVCNFIQENLLSFFWRFLEFGKYFENFPDKDTLEIIFENTENKLNEIIDDKSENDSKLLIKILHVVVMNNRFEKDYVTYRKLSNKLRKIILIRNIENETKILCGIIIMKCYEKNFTDNGIAKDNVITFINYDIGLTELEKNLTQIYLWNGCFSIDSIRNFLLKDKDMLYNCVTNLTLIAKRCNLKESITIPLARILLSVTKRIESDIEPNVFSSIDINVIKILTFTWNTVEHYSSTVKYISNEILCCAIKIIDNLTNKAEFLKDVIQYAFKFNAYQATRYLIFMNIYLNLKSPETTAILMETLDCIISDVIGIKSVPESVQTPMKQMLIRAMHYNFGIKDEDEWLSFWTSHLLQFLKKKWFWLVEGLIEKAMSLHPKVMTHISNTLLEQFDDDAFLVTLKCISCIKDKPYSNYISESRLFETVIQQKLHLKMSAFKLVVLKVKKSESYSKSELCYILEFYKYNLNAENSQEYDIILSVTKRFIEIFKISSHAIEKQSNNEQLIIYKKFAKNFYRMCIINLEYAREIFGIRLCLEIVYRLLPLYDFMNLDDKHLKIIYKLIEHSYDDIKKLVSKILLFLIKMEKFELEKLEIKFDDIINLLLSNKHDNVPTATHQLQLYFEYNYTKFEKSFHEYLDSFLDMLLVKLREAVSSVRSFMSCYGYLFAIRYFMEQYSFFNEEFAKNLILICVDLHSKIRKFVYIDLPDDKSDQLEQDNCINVIFDDFDQDSEINSRMLSQLISLSSWKTMKEIVLIFAYATAKIFNLDDSNDCKSHILSVTEIIIQILTKSKHRAILEETSHVCYRICSNLWKSSDSDLRELPKKLLSEGLEFVTKSENSLNSIRRCGGYPYLFKVILASGKNANNNDTFCLYMDSLLDSINDLNTNVNVQISVLHILSAIYRDRRFKQSVSKYIETGLIMCIGISKKSESELVQNATNSLFSGLLTRIFGLSKKRIMSDEEIYEIVDKDFYGKLSSDAIFRKYPNLYTFIEMELKNFNISNIIYQGAYLFKIAIFLLHLYETDYDKNPYNLHNLVDHLLKIKLYTTLRPITTLIANLSLKDQLMQILSDIVENVTLNYNYDNETYNFNLQLMKTILKIRSIDLAKLNFVQFFTQIFDNIRSFDAYCQDSFLDIVFVLIEKEYNFNEDFFKSIDVNAFLNQESKMKAVLLKMRYANFGDVFNVDYQDVDFLDILVTILLFKDADLLKNHDFPIDDYIKLSGIKVDKCLNMIEQIYQLESFHLMMESNKNIIMKHTNDFMTGSLSLTAIKKLLILLYYKDSIRNIDEVSNFFALNLSQFTDPSKCILTMCFMRFLATFKNYGRCEFFTEVLYLLSSSLNDSLRMLAAVLLVNPDIKWLFDQYGPSYTKCFGVSSIFVSIFMLLSDENILVRNITSAVLQNLGVEKEFNFTTISPKYAIKIIADFICLNEKNVILHVLQSISKVLIEVQQQDNSSVDRSMVFNPAVLNNFIEPINLIRIMQTSSIRRMKNE